MEAVSWEVALETAAKGLKAAGAELATLASSSATVEELYLLGKITRALGSAPTSIIACARRISATRRRSRRPASVGSPSPTSSTLDALLVVGSNLRREVPVLAHRVRKARESGAKVAFLNPTRFDYLFPVAAYLESAPAKQLADLAAVYSACLDGAAPPKHLAALVSGAQVNTAHRAIAAALKSGASARSGWARWRFVIRRMPICARWPPGIAAATGASAGLRWPKAAMPPGAYLAGAVPHRDAGGIERRRRQDAREMLSRRSRPTCSSAASSPGPTAGRRGLEDAGAADVRGRRHAVRRRQLKSVAT